MKRNTPRVLATLASLALMLPGPVEARSSVETIPDREYQRWVRIRNRIAELQATPLPAAPGERADLRRELQGYVGEMEGWPARYSEPLYQGTGGGGGVAALLGELGGAGAVPTASTSRPVGASPLRAPRHGFDGHRGDPLAGFTAASRGPTDPKGGPPGTRWSIEGARVPMELDGHTVYWTGDVETEGPDGGLATRTNWAPGFSVVDAGGRVLWSDDQGRGLEIQGRDGNPDLARIHREIGSSLLGGGTGPGAATSPEGLPGGDGSAPGRMTARDADGAFVTDAAREGRARIPLGAGSTARWLDRDDYRTDLGGYLDTERRALSDLESGLAGVYGDLATARSAADPRWDEIATRRDRLGGLEQIHAGLGTGRDFDPGGLQGTYDPSFGDDWLRSSYDLPAGTPEPGAGWGIDQGGGDFPGGPGATWSPVDPWSRGGGAAIPDPGPGEPGSGP